MEQQATSIQTGEAKAHAVERLERVAAELGELRNRLGRAELELTTLRAMLAVPQAMDNKQLKWRCNLLAATAEHSGREGRVCPVCGKAKGAAERLANHLYRRHPDQVRSMPAHRFE